MSGNNVEVVRRAMKAFRWGPEGLTPQQIHDLTDEFWDPDADYYPSRKFPESRPCHGRAEIMHFFSEYHRAWERIEVEALALVPVGEDRVLTHVILSGEGRGSGLELRANLYQSIWVRHGRILREEDHFTAEAALRAFGLDERGPEAAGLLE